MDEKSYSGRRSSSRSGLLALLIEPTLARGGGPCADEADGFPPVRMRNDKDTPRRRQPDRDVPQLVHRVCRVREGSRQRIVEDSARLVKIDRVLLEVRDSLRRIPLKDHAGSLRHASDWPGLSNTKISCGAPSCRRRQLLRNELSREKFTPAPAPTPATGDRWTR